MSPKTAADMGLTGKLAKLRQSVKQWNGQNSSARRSLSNTPLRCNAMTPAQAQKALIAAEKRYWDEVDRIGEAVRLAHVVPFCDKHKVKFTAGMGGWSFHGAAQEGRPGYPDKAWASHDFSDLPKRLSAALLLDTAGNNDLGSLINDYSPTA